MMFRLVDSDCDAERIVALALSRPATALSMSARSVQSFCASSSFSPWPLVDRFTAFTVIELVFVSFN